MESVIPLVDGECVLVERFLEPARADRFFPDIRQTARRHQPQLTLFGKAVRPTIRKTRRHQNARP